LQQPSPPRRQAVAQLLKAEKWGDAASMLMRFAVACDGMGARNSQCKAYLGAVVVWLAAGRATEAWNTYQAGLGWGGGEFISTRRLHACRLGLHSRARTSLRGSRGSGCPPPCLPDRLPCT
jgi:hypothetical protein